MNSISLWIQESIFFPISMRLSTILARLDNYDGPFVERMLAILVFSAKQELMNDKHHCLNFRVQFVSSPACALTVNQSQGMASSKEVLDLLALKFMLPAFSRGSITDLMFEQGLTTKPLSDLTQLQDATLSNLAYSFWRTASTYECRRVPFPHLSRTVVWADAIYTQQNSTDSTGYYWGPKMWVHRTNDYKTWEWQCSSWHCPAPLKKKKNYVAGLYKKQFLLTSTWRIEERIPERRCRAWISSNEFQGSPWMSFIMTSENCGYWLWHLRPTTSSNSFPKRTRSS